MFTVCPKCALTLVVTAQDLRVAQGYVRCGRCSNVFNAIVGLTDDRGALGNAASAGTATTSIIRKAPSISDDEPAAPDPLSDTGETEAIYAEPTPDPDYVNFPVVFTESKAPARTAAPQSPPPATRAPGAVSFVAPPPGPPVKAPAAKMLDSEKRYSDTEGIDTYPESELEFNPDVTDVTKVFVEAAPVAFKGDGTGRFRKLVMGEEQSDGTETFEETFEAPPPDAPAPKGASAPGASVPSQRAGGANASAAPRPNGAAASSPNAPAAGYGANAASPNGLGSASTSNARGAAPGANTRGGASGSGMAPPSNAQGAASRAGMAAASNARGAASGANTMPASNGRAAAPGANTTSANAAASQTSRQAAPPSRTPAAPGVFTPDRDDEDLQIDSELRSLAARIDATSSRPAPKFPSAANDEALERAAEEEARGLGDIYAKAVPRPRERPRPPAPPPRAARNTLESDDGFADDAEMQAVDSAIDTFTPAAPPRSRFTWWVAGAAALSLLLVGQAIHHNRHSLATNALLNRPLTKFYRAIGVPLVPSWDLRSYDVRQLGASTSEGAAGSLTVRASLKNNSTQPLPLPLLRITMQDRYGNRIATRDVPPSGYVPGAVPAEAHLGVGQRIDAEMTFKDPGQNAVGFEIDACLATASGRIACANDAAPALR
jgi:predicted Zn finger-like uncharacterized protein